MSLLPVRQTVKPAPADKIDPGNAVVQRAQSTHQARSMTILTIGTGAPKTE